MGIKMDDTFILPLDFSDRGDKGGELRENGVPIFMRGCKYKAEAAAIAINSYDTNQALRAKQAEQNKMLREAVILAWPYLFINSVEDSKAESALEATKDQA